MRAPEFWRAPGPIPFLLSPLGGVYGLAGKIRRALASPFDPGIPVICVGNLVAGGAGKTPVALSLLQSIRSRGVEAHALCRGYGGSLPGPLRVEPARHSAHEVGDEALLLARAAPTWIARDRAAGARAAAAAGAQAIVMDDGFQNPSLKKHLSLLVVDGVYGFGNRRVMPAGPLREPIAAGLARADAVVVLGEDRAGIAGIVAGAKPFLFAEIVPTAGQTPGDEKRVLAFAGIGRPEKFFAMLEGMGLQVVARHAFDDHHRYRDDEIAALIAKAQEANAGIVTTEKDAVRLPPELRAKVDVVPAELAWRNTAQRDALLATVLPIFAETGAGAA
jgi:tetraacyldisaccharide 4'-kinase